MKRKLTHVVVHVVVLEGERKIHLDMNSMTLADKKAAAKKKNHVSGCEWITRVGEYGGEMADAVMRETAEEREIVARASPPERKLRGTAWYE